MYTSPDQTPRSFATTPREPLTGPVLDQDPAAVGGQPLQPHGGHQHGAAHQHGNGHHLMHLLMCAPMLLVVGAYLWAGRSSIGAGGTLAALVPAIGCMVMMGLMMRMMDHGSRH